MHLQTAWLLLIIWLAGVMLAKIYRKTATEYAGSTLSLSPVYSEFIPGVDVVRKHMNLESPISFRPRKKPCVGGLVRKGQNATCHACPRGTFSLPGFVVCRKLLDCGTIEEEVRVSKLLVNTGMYVINLAVWRGFTILYACPDVRAQAEKRNQLQTDLILKIQAHQKSLLIVGYCLVDACMVLYTAAPLSWYPLANLTLKPHPHNHWSFRLAVLYRILDLLSHVHSYEPQAHVLCRRNRITDLLQYFLISDSGEVAIFNFDAFLCLDSLNHNPLCSGARRNQKNVSFLMPPEVRHSNQAGRIKSIDQKVESFYTREGDVWVVPDLAEHLLRDVVSGGVVMDYLAAVHQRCKDRDVGMRPTMNSIAAAYKDTIFLLTNGMSL